MISRIIKVKVGVVSQSRRQAEKPLPRPWLYWISQKRNLIICFVIHCLVIHCTLNGIKNGSHSFVSLLTASNTEHVNLTWLPLEIMHRGHIWHDYPWPWASLTWLLYNLQLWRHRRWFRKFTVRFQPIRKEIVSSVYNNFLATSCFDSRELRSTLRVQLLAKRAKLNAPRQYWIQGKQLNMFHIPYLLE